MALADILAGFAQGFAGSRQRALERAEREDLKKLQVKALKRQLDEQDTQEENKRKLFELIGGGQPVPGNRPSMDDEGFAMPAATTAPKSLTDILADPQGQMALLQSGLMKPADILKSQKPDGMQLLQKLMGGQGAGGMELTGVKIGPDGQIMPDLSRPKFKTEFAAPDGRSMIQIDEFGRPMGTRPISPAEKPRTKGQDSVDTKFADEYVSFKAAGGYADISKQLEQLRETSKALDTEKGLTGGAVPMFSPGLTPEAVLKRTNPRAIEVRDNVLDSAQRNLRLVLGAQFTEKEGERLLSRVYDMGLKPSQNKKRVDRLISQIESAAAAKQEAINYFEKNGTLEGFKGKLWTLADFSPDSVVEKPSLKGPGKKDDPLGLR